MKKRFKISNRLLLIFFLVAVVLSLVAVYFSVSADTPGSGSAVQYRNYFFYAEPREEARVGVVIEDGGVQNATS